MRNPWEVFADKHPVGTVIEGEVKNITEFGLFVGLDGDIDGMVAPLGPVVGQPAKKPSRTIARATWSRPWSPRSTSRRSASRCRVKALGDGHLLGCRRRREARFDHHRHRDGESRTAGSRWITTA
jgi:hypothetical protein